MTKPPIVSDDPLVMKVRKILRSVEPRILPTETRMNSFGHECWVCPYCGELVHRRDKYRYKRWARGQEKIVDYSSYNMHFGAVHAKPFWKEKRLIALIRKELSK